MPSFSMRGADRSALTTAAGPASRPFMVAGALALACFFGCRLDVYHHVTLERSAAVAADDDGQAGQSIERLDEESMDDIAVGLGESLGESVAQP